MMLRRVFVVSLLIALLACAAMAVAKIAYPVASKQSTTDTYHGMTVADPYQWMERTDDPAVTAWIDQETALLQGYLDKLPARPEITKELSRIYGTQSTSYSSLEYRPGTLFAMKYQPPKEQPFIVALSSPDDVSTERIVVDPNTLDTTGLTSMDFYKPSLDGRYVAVCLSREGSEDGSVMVFDAATGKKLDDSVPRVNFPTAGGSVAWTADNKGFFYTRYPAKGERSDEDIHFYQQVYYHTLGTPTSQDTYQVGKDFPKIAEIELEASPDGKYLLAVVSNGDGGEYEHLLLDPSGKWTQLTKFSDRITKATFGRDEALYMLSLKGTPRGEILRMPLAKPELGITKPIVKEGNGVVNDFQPTTSKLYVVEQRGGPEGIKVYDLDGKEAGDVPVQAVASVSKPVWLDGDEMLYNEQSYLTPAAWFHYDPATGKASPTALKKTSVVTYDDAEVVRELVKSKDGTMVPINILRKKGTTLNGNNPTLLYGYGGYGINEAPYFSERQRLWLDQGGVYVTANIRGGGEFGEDWHSQGNLTRKQNVFDDFLACAEWLTTHGYTSPSKLAIEGGSNGGLLMGAALVQRPDLFAAVVTHVGIYDMLRVELSPNGLFNTTEFGTIKDPDQFKALYAYSPYHHVIDGTAYPAVLLTTGMHDGRVEPWQSFKMTARLQEATSSDRPILIRVSSTSGHGIGTSYSERVEQDADALAFLFDQLGMAYGVVR